MRIHGLACSVVVEGLGASINVGGYVNGREVLQIVVGMEDTITYVNCLGDELDYWQSFSNARVTVEWVDRPNVQSQTEWLIWLTELVGFSQDRECPDITGNGKFVPRAARDLLQCQKAAPQHPELKIVQPAAGPHLVPVSTKRTAVDADAGGPDGFDMDEPHPTVPVLSPMSLTERDDSGMRRLVVPKPAQDMDLRGQRVSVSGVIMTVHNVELSTKDGREVLVLSVK